MVRKLISEFVGTMLLVLFGCGTAVAVNNYVFSIYNISLPFTMLIIALAFGLVLTAIVSVFGKVSGAHVNPAVSIAMAIDKRMSVIECIEYVILFFGGINDIQNKANIVDVISSFGINFEKKGANYICFCPFHEHNYNTPSMSVNLEKGIYTIPILIAPKTFKLKELMRFIWLIREKVDRNIITLFLLQKTL